VFQAPPCQGQRLTIQVTPRLAAQIAGNPEEPCTERTITAIALLGKGTMGCEKNVLRHLLRHPIRAGRQSPGTKAYYTGPVPLIQGLKIDLWLSVRPLHE
jgi:hypothetical protein